MYTNRAHVRTWDRKVRLNDNDLAKAEKYAADNEMQLNTFLYSLILEGLSKRDQQLRQHKGDGHSCTKSA